MPKRRAERHSDDESSPHDTLILKRPRVEEKSATGASEAGDVYMGDTDVVDEASVEALLCDTSTESVAMKRNAQVDVISKCGIIESIEMHQFMCHKYLTFDFGPQMNFIIGRNGSGKSAVLYAIIIVLGGKIASTGRAKGLRSFIQDGQSDAEITIRIKNQGEGAFKPHEYGGSISITRRFTKHGCTTWRITNDNGKTINTKREEVTAICEHMNIQVDNPLNILTQDSARDFLSYSSPKQVYKMFLDGTSLEQLDKDYEICNESLDLTVETMKRKSEALSGLERTYKLASERYDEAIQARRQQDRVVELEKELAWAAVNEKARDRSNMFEETASQEQRVARVQSAVDEAQKTFNSAIDDVRRAENTYEELACIQHLTEERRELHQKLCRAEGNFSDVKSERAQMNISYQETNPNISMLQKRIQAAVAQTLASQGKRDDHNRQLTEVSEAQRRGNESLPGILDRIKQADEECRQMEAKMEARNAEVEVAQESASHARNMIEQARELERNRYAAYGKNIQRLLGRISLTSWAGATPIGPLGAYVRCREPEKWGDILRSQLSDMFTAYAVTDHRDVPTLRGMLQQSGNEHLSIIVSEQADMFDYSHGEPPENMLTVLRALEISDPYVLRILINQSGIERTFLSTTRSEGEDMLRQYGGTRQVWTADGFLIRRFIEGGESHSSLNQRRNDNTSTLLTGRDDDAQRRHYQNELQEKEAQIQRLVDLRAVFLEKKKELDKEKNKTREMEESINRAKACQQQLQEAATGDMAATIARLEALKKESEDEKTAIEGHIINNTALKMEIFAEIAELQKQLDGIRNQIDENDKQRRELRAAIDGAVHRLTAAQHALKHTNAKLFEEMVKLDGMQRKGRLLEEEGYALVVKALVLSPQMETKRSKEDVHGILEITRAALRERERQRGATVEETVVELNKTKCALETLKNEYKQLHQLRAMQIKSVAQHSNHWHNFRSHISLRTNLSFQHNLYHRGYLGKIAFDLSVYRQVLAIRVQNQAMSHWKDSLLLSGGEEKCIITFSLLLALWEVAGRSVMCLDGFDVFMDAENRKKSMELLIKDANAADRQYILTTPHEIDNIALGNRPQRAIIIFFTTMFYIIGLGLCDENDITVRGLQAIKNSARVYLEAYTSILMVNKERLEAFYEKPLILADRDMVETNSDAILADADKEDVSLLVVGDPFGATTHTDIILRARGLGIPTRVIHNASIMNAAGACGLQLYNFGQTVSLVFFTDTWKPDSFYDRIKENADLGLHTLVLLDIKVKEQSEENLARGRKIYEPPRYMTIPQAVNQLIEIEGMRKTAILSPDNTLAVALSRVGGGHDNERIVAGTLTELVSQPVDIYGQPLHSLIIVGKRLHHLEVAYAESYALNREKWRQVAQDVYGCALD